MIRTQIQMEEATYTRLKREAARRSCSISEVARQGILQELARAERNERREKALTVVGRFRSGLTDLAEHHDAYLDDAW